MADTGAPWEIPYAEPADLVRDWPALSEDVADAVADGLTTANIALGPNVVQTAKLDTFSSSSTSPTAITGLSVSITPSVDTSKVLVIVSFTVNINALAAVAYRLKRGSTIIGVGTTEGSRLGATGAGTIGSSDYWLTLGSHFLDSPAVATATTYSVDAWTTGGTFFLGRSTSNVDNANAAAVRTPSVITAIEVAA